MGLTPSSTLVEFDVLTPASDIARMLELHSESVPVYRLQGYAGSTATP